LRAKDPQEHRGESVRAAVTTSAGGPIEISDVPDVERGSGEILVRVMAASVNRLDRMVYERGAGMGRDATFPLIQGIDAAGVIESGSGAMMTGLRVVMKPSIACRRCRWCRANRWADCVDARTFGIDRQGGFAELISVPRTNLFKLPDEISFAAGAAAAHTHAVVLRMIRSASELPPEPITMVTGAGGALGTAAVQIASALGHRVISVASSDTKLLATRDLGALVGLNRVTGDLVEDVATSTDGAGVDLVIETTGVAEVIAEAYASLGRGGSLVLVAAAPGAMLELDALDVYRSRRRVIGSANSNLADFTDTYRMMASHGIEPVIASRFGLEQAAEAMEAVLARDRIGKVVIEIGEGE
jgi:D-arabinose 1-dehydrogenase-like Zn-dependent alcohol dehydrogenase